MKKNPKINHLSFHFRKLGEDNPIKCEENRRKDEEVRGEKNQWNRK